MLPEISILFYIFTRNFRDSVGIFLWRVQWISSRPEVKLIGFGYWVLEYYSSITGSSPSVCLVSYPWHSLEESYPSAEMGQSTFCCWYFIFFFRTRYWSGVLFVDGGFSILGILLIFCSSSTSVINSSIFFCFYLSIYMVFSWIWEILVIFAKVGLM